MNIHKNARLTLQGRVLLVRRITEEGWRIVDAVNAAGISVRQSYRWLARYRSGGDGALADRSSAPHQCKHGIGADRAGEIERLRQQRMSGPAIARELSMPTSTVGIILRRLGLGKLARLERALGWFAGQGVTVERVMTDNGSAYRSHAFRGAVAAAGVKHKRTRPCTPRTNGEAERFIQNSLREWVYARPYASSQERTLALMPWLDHYNTERPHTALAHRPPAARLRQSQLLGSTEETVASSRPATNPDRPRRSPSLKQGPMPDQMNNVLGNDN